MRMKNRNSTSTRCPLLHGLARLPDFFLLRNMSGAQVPALQTQARRFQGARVPAGCEVGRTCRTALLSSHGARCPGMLPSKCTTCTTRAGTIGGPARKSCPLAQSLELCRTKAHGHTGTDTGRVQAWPAAGCQSDAFRHHSCRFPRDACQQTHHQPCLQPRHAPVSPLVTGPARCRTVQEVFVPCGKSMPCLRPSLLP